ncbi:MAG: hypothetical protein IAE81_08480 [Caldilineaceae bacterium]|nr:hypothetical protein [Caldilineaceae bacterium]
MSAGKDRLELKLDVLDMPGQRASALMMLSPQELIAATLQEFGEVERLGIDPADYELLELKSGNALDEKPLGELFGKDAKDVHLQLVEKRPATPRGAQPATEAIYLRELGTGRVFRLHWLPAIIGRPDRNLPDNQLLAVNLEALAAGLRVSRRHVKVIAQSGQYFVQRMSGNPALLRRASGEAVSLLDNSRTPIAAGDVIVLERSQIALKFLVENNVQRAPAAPQADAHDNRATTAIDENPDQE